MVFCFFKQKTAYEIRISYWSSDVCSSDLHGLALKMNTSHPFDHQMKVIQLVGSPVQSSARFSGRRRAGPSRPGAQSAACAGCTVRVAQRFGCCVTAVPHAVCGEPRSEEHTSELQSLMRI